jgi:DNA-binding XRE family transcriptional regulator
LTNTPSNPKTAARIRRWFAWAVLLVLAIGGVVAGSMGTGLWASPVLSGSIVAVAVVCVGALLRSTASQGSSGQQTLIEAIQLSDSAKRVLFREHEVDLLRRTIETDIEAGEYNAALVLCEQLATVFGAVEEGEQLRSRIQTILHQRHESTIRGEVEKFDDLLSKQEWVAGYQEAARLRRLYPDSPLLHDLEQRIADARAAYRHDLEDRFLSAAQREEVEEAMVLLKELDRYLTPDEARRFRDTAKAVVDSYRDTLGTRFSMAVNDHRWTEAIEFGDAIIRQFPNTKMAQEVRGLQPTINQRAAEEANA